MTAKSVLMRPQCLRPGTRALTCYATGIAKGYPAPWGKNIFALLQQKLQNLK